MRLHFNVLWIDNQPDQIRSTQERVNIALSKEGFRLKPINAASYEECGDKLDPEGNILRDEIDLVVVDWDLGNDKIKGDEAILEIRKQVPYKDLVLYSAVAPDDLKSKIQGRSVQAVFTVHRDALADTIIGLFQSLTKKVLDLDHSRGIVMAATSDIDHIVRDCVVALETQIGEDDRDKVRKYIIRQLEDSKKNAEKALQDFTDDPNVAKVLTNHVIMGASRKLRLLQKLLELLNHPEHREHVKKYFEEVPRKRDKLGHVRLVASQSRTKFVGPDALEMSEEELKELRIALLNHRDRFEELAEMLGIPL